nr:hypothetical protein [Tanacetum cinerariifolium]
FVPEHLLKPKEQQKSIQEFTDYLFQTTSSRFSPTPLRELTPPKDSSKGKAVTIIEEPGNELVNIKKNEELRKLFNPATLKAQAQKWTGHEAKKAKMMQEYKHHISFRANTLPITKINYVVNSKKEATMKITRGDNPLNLVVHPNFKLKTLGFSEWLKVHALAFKKYGTSNSLLLQSLRAKFQWVINQVKRLGLPPSPELATFGLTAEKKKREKIELIKEVFITKNVRVDGMDQNLIPSSGIMPIQGLVINELELDIFFMNGNTNIGFQRESEFHLTPNIELIRLQR